jgi:mannan endo-1,4-beta-mannosidase
VYRRRVLGWVGVAAISAVLAGCSGSTAATPTPQTSTAATTATATMTTTLPPGPTATSPRSAPAHSSAPASAPSAYVTASGRNLIADAKVLKFIGVNIYDAAATSKYSCRPGSKLSKDQLTQTLAFLHDHAGITVLRFWAYQTYTQGATDFTGMDQVIDAAQQVGMRVLPVLEDGPGNCTTNATVTPKSDFHGDTWYTAGYKVPYGNASLSYRDYVAKVAAHYKNNPTILGWSMMNEADTSARDAQGQSVLVDFAKDIGSVIAAADPNHLISVGTQSNGAPGASGTDFTAVYSQPNIGFAEVHDWGYWGSDQQPMPGGVGKTPPDPKSTVCQSTSAPIGCSFAQAPALNKPLIVGEAGIKASDDASRNTRAGLLRAKMDAAFQAGSSGYILWSVTTANTDGYDIHINDNDPLLNETATLAQSIQ